MSARRDHRVHLRAFQAFEVLRPDALSRLSAAQRDALAELNRLELFEDPDHL